MLDRGVNVLSTNPVPHTWLTDTWRTPTANCDGMEGTGWASVSCRHGRYYERE